MLAGLPGCATDDAAPGWSLAHEGLRGALFSVSGTSSDDVWAVGSDPGDGPYVLQWDGDAWSRVDSGASGDLWWVHATPQTVWMSGADGLVLQLPRTAQQPQVVPTPTDSTLFGIHAFDDEDVWAVGGDPGSQSGVILRFDGTEFRSLEVPEEAAGVTFFKVWGSDPSNVWIVGHGGVALHWDGEGFTTFPVPNGRPLLTVHGFEDDVVAVGGFGSGFIVDVGEDALVDRTPSMEAVPQLNGVHVSEDRAWAAGSFGAIWTRSSGDWSVVSEAPPIRDDYHAIYADPEGGVWAVGGKILTPPFTNGVLARLGTEAVGGWSE